MVCIRTGALLLASLILVGCHLIFRYEDRPPDGAVPADLGKKDQPSAPDRTRQDKDHPDATRPPDRGATLAVLPNRTMKVPSGTKDLLAVWGSGPKRVYAVGKGATLLHYNGQSWSQIALANPAASEHFTGVWGEGSSASAKLYISTSAGKVRTYAPSSSAWGVAYSGAKALNAIHGSGGKIQAPGEDGALVSNWDGSWKLRGLNVTEDLYGVWTLASGEYFLVGDAAVAMRYYKAPFGTWWWVPLPSIPSCKLKAVWGASSSKMYVVGLSGCSAGYACTSGSMGKFVFTPGLIADWYGIWGSSKGELFLVGKDPNKPKSTLVGRHTSSGWMSSTVQFSGKADSTLRGIWGDDMGKLFAVGHGGVILEN